MKKSPLLLFLLQVELTLPLYSIIKHVSKHPSAQKIILFYGNQTINITAYLDEIIKLQSDNPHFTFIPTMANPDAAWSETGFITESMIKKYILDLNAPIYYVCGSPAMVTTLQETLAEMGINEDNIKVEDFPGY